ncbi:sigma-70 family RNA polymerase sigma factor [Ruminococcaceae bacterium OttesenSCG-928-A16]|nr:sigma-70 family RNA polymerase sigma factor [Ruminococcaceae bacterium OttesenSCG-928-A16]
MKHFTGELRIRGSKAADTVAFTPACAKAKPDLARMMDCYGNALLRLCFMYLKDTQLAEDAVQETFLKVYKNYHLFDGSNSEKAWVNRIAINVCKDMLRSAWNRRVSVVEELAEIADENGTMCDPADTTLIAAVMQLKPKYKEVILLFYYQDMKIADIATALNVPESTISVRLKRAREHLKKHLKEWYANEGAEIF